MTDRMTHIEVAESLDAAKAEKEEELNQLEIDTQKKVRALRDEIRQLDQQAEARRRAHRVEQRLAQLKLTTASPEYKLMREVYDRAIQREDLSGGGTRKKNMAWFTVRDFVVSGIARGMKTIELNEGVDEITRKRCIFHLLSDAHLLMAGENTKRYLELAERAWEARCEAWNDWQDAEQESAA